MLSNVSNNNEIDNIKNYLHLLKAIDNNDIKSLKQLIKNANNTNCILNINVNQ